MTLTKYSKKSSLIKYQISTRKIINAIKCNQRFFVINPNSRKINAIIAVMMTGVVKITITSSFS